jgi:hypothetical protein
MERVSASGLGRVSREIRLVSPEKMSRVGRLLGVCTICLPLLALGLAAATTWRRPRSDLIGTVPRPLPAMLSNLASANGSPGKGKRTAILFYVSPTCGHCREELSRWKDILGSPGQLPATVVLTIVVAGRGDVGDEVRSILSTGHGNVGSTLVRDSTGAIARSLGVRGVPSIAFVVGDSIREFVVGQTSIAATRGRIERVFGAAALERIQ